MRRLLIIIFLLYSIISFGQLKSGFSIDEAKHTIAICNSYNFIKQFNSDQTIIPNGYNLSYTSDVMSMDNKFQVYENGRIGVINFRGSTGNVISWVENCYSAMIPAKGTIFMNGNAAEYTFAKDEEAAVHAGYGLTIVILSDVLKAQINALNSKGIYDIIITGHSQGGALATMTRAYLENMPKGELSSKNKFKTYSYAQPMCGNKEFAIEYNERFSDKGTSYTIINPQDPVPHMPFNYEEETLITKDKVEDWLFGDNEFNPMDLGKDAFIRLFESSFKSYVNNSNMLLNKILRLKFGEIEMPDFVNDINYFPTGNRKEIAPFEYPQIKLNVSNLSEEALKDLPQDADGNWYKQEPKLFQHKPYNYYVGILQKWDEDAFENLEMRYLESDL